MKVKSILMIVFGGALLIVPWLAMAEEEAKEIGIPSSYEQIISNDSHNTDPAVSPGGKRIAFVSDRTGNDDIFVRDLSSEGGEEQKTSHTKDDRHPTWAGEDLVYESKRAGSWDLYRMSAGEAGELQWSSRPGAETYASVHPQTGKLLYMANPRKGFRLSFGPRDVDICVADKDPDQSRVIAQGIQPRWSPDGSRVVFSSRRTKNHDIWLVSSDGGAALQLTTDKAADISPCFSPDGSQIVFASKRTENYDLWVMDADGSKMTQLTSHPNDETDPFWAEDGMIYFVFKDKVGTTSIYAIEEP